MDNKEAKDINTNSANSLADRVTVLGKAVYKTDLIRAQSICKVKRGTMPSWSKNGICIAICKKAPIATPIAKPDTPING